MKRFTESHEWIQLNGQEAVVGITTYAHQELGQIVHLSLPEVGARIEQGSEVAILESTKAAVDIYAPVSGVVTAVNLKLKDDLTLLNTACETEGWLYQVAVDSDQQYQELMDLEAYLAMIQ